MSNIKFKLNLAGLNELMKSDEMKACLQQAGEAVANNAGSEYGVRVHDASFEAIANIYPDSKKAAKDNYERNALLKALLSTSI